MGTRSRKPHKSAWGRRRGTRLACPLLPARRAPSWRCRAPPPRPPRLPLVRAPTGRAFGPKTARAAGELQCLSFSCSNEPSDLDQYKSNCSATVTRVRSRHESRSLEAPVRPRSARSALCLHSRITSSQNPHPPLLLQASKYFLCVALRAVAPESDLRQGEKQGQRRRRRQRNGHTHAHSSKATQQHDARGGERGEEGRGKGKRGGGPKTA